MEKTFIEFFAGIGLMRMGLENAGWRVVFANDIDPAKLQMYRAQFSDADTHFSLGDIHSLAANDVPSASLATASFPCNDLSLAGSRSGLKGAHSSALWGFTSLLEKMGKRRPKLILIENVPGFLTSHHGKDFESALIELNRLGYLVDAFIVDAARFVPQSRQRLFVAGILTKPVFATAVEETPEFLETDLRPRALSRFIFEHPKVSWLIRPLPAIASKPTRIESILEDLPVHSPEWWDEKRVAYLLNQMSARHKLLAEEMTARASYTYGTVFRRIRKGKSMAELRTDGIAGCLRTPRGGSGRQILFKAGRDKVYVRLLNAHECARLMGAGTYRVDVPLNQALFGFGDAVCVPVVEWIAKNYLNPVMDEMFVQSEYLKNSA